MHRKLSWRPASACGGTRGCWSARCGWHRRARTPDFGIGFETAALDELERRGHLGSVTASLRDIEQRVDAERDRRREATIRVVTELSSSSTRDTIGPVRWWLLSRKRARAIARQHVENQGLPWTEPVAVSRRLLGGWNVVTHSDYRGGNIFLRTTRRARADRSDSALGQTPDTPPRDRADPGVPSTCPFVG